jgi:hypothetical protein
MKKMRYSMSLNPSSPTSPMAAAGPHGQGLNILLSYLNWYKSPSLYREANLIPKKGANPIPNLTLMGSPIRPTRPLTAHDIHEFPIPTHQEPTSLKTRARSYGGNIERCAF